MSLRLPTQVKASNQRRKSDGALTPKRVKDEVSPTPSLRIMRAPSIDANTQQSKTNFNDFDDLLAVIGSEGKLQKQILYIVLFPFCAILPFFALTQIFLINEPNHWCHVPNKTANFSNEAWKDLTIPLVSGSTTVYSKCDMYVGLDKSENRSVVPCAHGWEYDRSDYHETILTYLNWVCTKAHYATGVLTAFALGSCVGTPIFGWAGDKIGRKLVFFFIVIINLLSRGIGLFIPQHYFAFLAAYFVVGSTFPMVYVLPFTLLCEICSNDFRSWVYGSTWMIWVIGICLLPFIAWLCADWFLIGVVTLVPGIFVLLSYKYLPESPRWLLSVGRVDEATDVIKSIAEVNGTADKFKEGQIEEILQEIRNKQLKSETKTPQIWDLFKRKRLAFFTILLGVVWSMNTLVYYGITINSTSMAGNQFLNFFYLSVIELPAGLLGRILVEKAGRRWPQVGFFVLCAIGFGLAAIGVNNGSIVLVIMAVIISKFSVALTSLVVNLQANEIFPTQLRSSGNGFVGTFAAVVGVAAPIIVYLKAYYDGAPYIAFGIISLVGVISSAYIPETLRQSLPETVEDSNNLGTNATFWSYLPEDYKSNNNETAKGKVNEGFSP